MESARERIGNGKSNRLMAVKVRKKLVIDILANILATIIFMKPYNLRSKYISHYIGYIRVFNKMK